MVDVSLYIQIHSEDLTVIFLAENSLQKDEKEINNIVRAITFSSDILTNLDKILFIESFQSLAKL